MNAIEGGNGLPPEPDWGLIYTDDLLVEAAHKHWGEVMRELRDTEKLAAVNAHQVKRLVMAYVAHDEAAAKVAEQGAVVLAKRTRVPSYNPWWTILRQSDSAASALEAELTLSPRRRTSGGKVVKRGRAATASSNYLKPVGK